MAGRVPARLSAAQGRRFGLTVGLAFLVLASVMWWRTHPLAAQVLGSFGGLLVVAGLLAPTRLGPVERAWMRLAHAISKVTTPVVMAVMYFVLMTPLGIGRRVFGRNPLIHLATRDSFWHARPENSRRSRSMERQF